eukprot:192306-Alexandrium_andersonii.AAC.1
MPCFTSCARRLVMRAMRLRIFLEEVPCATCSAGCWASSTTMISGSGLPEVPATVGVAGCAMAEGDAAGVTAGEDAAMFACKALCVARRESRSLSHSD